MGFWYHFEQAWWYSNKGKGKVQDKERKDCANQQQQSFPRGFFVHCARESTDAGFNVRNLLPGEKRIH